MKITEKDLYNYVFYPESLSSQSYKYISNNLEKFQEEIKLLTELKLSLENPIDSDRIVSKIKEKIEQFEVSNNIKLNISLADDSNYLTPDDINLSDAELNFSTNIFTDKSSKFLAKITTKNNETSILISCKDQIELLDFAITIEPSNETFKIDNSSEPLILKPARTITGIIIHLHYEK